MMGIVLAAAVAAQDTAPLSSGDKRYTLHVPTAWQVKVEETKGDLRLRLRCEVPDATGKVTVDVYDLIGGMLTPLGQANFERPTQAKRHKAVSTELGREPVPHLVWLPG